MRIIVFSVPQPASGFESCDFLTIMLTETVIVVREKKGRNQRLTPNRGSGGDLQGTWRQGTCPAKNIKRKDIVFERSNGTSTNKSMVTRTKEVSEHRKERFCSVKSFEVWLFDREHPSIWREGPKGKKYIWKWKFRIGSETWQEMSK